jgi:hypothetical protein
MITMARDPNVATLTGHVDAYVPGHIHQYAVITTATDKLALLAADHLTVSVTIGEQQDRRGGLRLEPAVESQAESRLHTCSKSFGAAA